MTYQVAVNQAKIAAKRRKEPVILIQWKATESYSYVSPSVIPEQGSQYFTALKEVTPLGEVRSAKSMLVTYYGQAQTQVMIP